MSPSPALKFDQPIADIYIGRQAILDRQQQLFAYELLYRNGSGNYAELSSQEVATAEVLVNVFLEIGFDKLVGSHQAFINLPRGLLLGDEILALPKDKVVLEVLENIKADELTRDAMVKLRDSGYQIALDDFILNDENQKLLPYANIIKVDLRALDQEQLVQQVQAFKKFPIKLLAEKVETHDEFRFCMDLGFDYFQGYFFYKPEVVKGQKLSANRLAMLQLLTKLFDSAVTLKEIEQIIKHDVSLSVKLLRVCNSATFAPNHRIESIAQAISMLGMNRVRQWISIIVFSGVENKPLELSKISLLRAYMCALIARDLGWDNTEKAFTVGMFSALDALFDQPMQEVLANMSLAEDIVTGLTEKTGALGELLQTVIDYQQGTWQVNHLNIETTPLRRYFIEAMVWADDVCAALV